ncbi:MAG: histidine kinase dimerization/phosphoacceptor domain -containing protein, partial [Paracoccaceae bacterium]
MSRSRFGRRRSDRQRLMVIPNWIAGLARLRVRLALIIAVALAPAGLLAVMQALNAFEASDERRAAELQATALAAVDQERRTIVEIKQTVKLAAFAMQSELSGSRRGCADLFASLAKEHEWMTRAVLLDRQGDAVCGVDRPLSMAGTEHWKRFIERPDIVFSAGRSGRLGGEWVSVAYYPVADPHGEVFAIAIGLDLSFLRRLTNPPPGRPAFALLGARGGPMNITAEAEPDIRWLPENRVILQQFGDRAVKDIGADGVKRAYFTSELETGQLWAVTARTRPGLLSTIFSSEGYGLLLPILLWAIAVTVAYFAIDILVSRHIDKLRAAAFRIGQGDLDTPVGDFSEAPKEMRALGHSIKAMAARISDREAKLQETLDMQRRLLLEVHHRVKNNLQTISSLMNLETRRVEDPIARRSLTQIQDRIHALALVHQNLYAAEHLERVALNQLVQDICDHLETSLAPKGRGPRIRTILDEIIVDTTTIPVLTAANE